MDFLAVSISPWHAVGVDAALLSRQALGGKDPRGAVLVVPHPRDGFLIDEGDFLVARAADDMHIVRVEPKQGGVPRWFSTLLDDRRLLRCLARSNDGSSQTTHCVDLLSPMRPSLPLARLLLEMPNSPHPRFVIYDEGVGLYLNDEIWKTVRRLDGQEQPAAMSFRRRYRDALRARIEAKAAKQERRLFNSNQATGALCLEEGIAHSYREVFREWARRAPHEQWLPDAPVALLVTQPVSELDQLPREKEEQVLRRIIEKLSDAGYAVLIKSHPRERPGKYECLTRDTPVGLLADDISAEAYFAGLRAGDIVVGLTSTALLTASALFEIPTYSQGSLFLAEPRLGSLFRAAYDDFMRVCRRYVKDDEPEAAT